MRTGRSQDTGTRKTPDMKNRENTENQLTKQYNGSESESTKLEKTLRTISEGVSAATGDAFFHSLVEHLTRSLGTRFAFVGELSRETPDHVRTIAVFAGGQRAENFEYALKDSPCENVVGQTLRCYPQDVQKKFPHDDLLKELHVESYIGTPLFDSAQHAIGLMVVMDDKPLGSPHIAESTLQIFAYRASSELERKQSEEVLRKSENQYRIFIENFQGIAFSGTLDFTPLFFHGAVEKITGYTEQDFLSGNPSWIQIIHQDDLGEIHESIEKIRSVPDFSADREYRIMRKDGQICWVHELICNVCDAFGKPVSVQGAIYDITARKDAEQELIKTRERLEFLLRSSPAVIYTCEYGGNWSANFMTENLSDVLGYEARENLENPTFWADRIHPEDKNRILEGLKSLEENDYFAHDYRFLHKDGTYRWMHDELKVVRDEEGRSVECIGYWTDITERKQAEEALRESEEKYRRLFENANDSIFIIDPESRRFLDVNENAAKRLGYTRSELLELTIDEIDTPMASSRNDEIIGELMKSGSVVFEHAHRHKDGTEIPVEISSRVIEFGGRTVFQSFARNITERKKAGGALREERDRAQQYLDVAGVMLVAIDANQIVSLINKKGAEILGYREEEIVGKNWFDMMIPERMKEDIKNVFGQLMAGEIKPVEYFENPIITKSGEERIIAWHNTILMDGSRAITGTLSSGEDITERKKAEDALKLSEARLKALLQLNRMTDASIQDIASFMLEQGVKLTGSTMGFTGLMNNEGTALATHAVHSPAMKGCAVVDQPLHFSMDEAGLWADAVREKRPIIINDYSTPHPEKKGLPGGHVPLARVLSLPFMEGDRVVGVAVVGNKEAEYDESDIQQLTLLMNGMWRHILRKKMDDELLKAQKLESVGLLAGGLAHDFNNLLTGILGNIELAKMYADPADKVYEKLTDAGQAFSRAKDLTQQLLTFSRGGEPVKKIVSLGALVKNSAKFALRGSNVRCKFFIPKDLLSAEIDEGQITQVISNLIINASQAMPSGGTVKVFCENVVVSQQDALPLKDGEYVRISIRDKGIGMPREHLPKIFDPYFTTKQKGSGLGLATSYSIIKKHEGHIAAESEMGAGTTFHLYLPASMQMTTPAGSDDETLFRGTGRVLIMDDEDAVRTVAGEMLSYLGFSVAFADNGEKALELYGAAQEQGTPFDAVVMDLTIPGGMGGKEAAQKLIEASPNARIIVSSGYSHDPVMAEYRTYGFASVVTKPFKIKELRDSMRQALSNSS